MILAILCILYLLMAYIHWNINLKQWRRDNYTFNRLPKYEMRIKIFHEALLWPLGCAKVFCEAYKAITQEIANRVKIIRDYFDKTK